MWCGDAHVNGCVRVCRDGDENGGDVSDWFLVLPFGVEVITTRITSPEVVIGKCPSKLDGYVVCFGLYQKRNICSTIHRTVDKNGDGDHTRRRLLVVGVTKDLSKMTL